MRIVALTVLLFTSLLASAAPTEAVKRFLGEETLATLRGATRMEAFRVSPEGKDAADDRERMGGYPILGRGRVKVAPKALTAVLLDEKTYDFGSAKRCLFSPGVGYRVWKGKRAVDVLLCFSCNELRVVGPAADGSVREATEDFDRVRERLVKLAKRSFPEDAEIQGLTVKSR
jgi:hypothetical protein